MLGVGGWGGLLRMWKEEYVGASGGPPEMSGKRSAEEDAESLQKGLVGLEERWAAFGMQQHLLAGSGIVEWHGSMR